MDDKVTYFVTIQVNAQNKTEDFKVKVPRSLSERTARQEAIKVAQRTAAEQGKGTIVKAIRRER